MIYAHNENINNNSSLFKTFDQNDVRYFAQRDLQRLESKTLKKNECLRRAMTST